MGNTGVSIEASIVGILALMSIFPLTAMTFLKSRLPRKNEEYQRMLEKLGYTDQSGPAYVPSLDTEYITSDYFFPVVFASLIAGLCAFTMILGSQYLPLEAQQQQAEQKQAEQKQAEQKQAQLKQTEQKKVEQKQASAEHPKGKMPNPDNKKQVLPNINLLLNGPSIATLEGLTKNDKNKLFAMLIISLAFAGSYTWSIQYLYRRLATLDLAPGTYYSIGIRIILSVFVALLVYYSFTGGDISEYKHGSLNSPSAMAIYAFLAGMFPQRWLKWLQDKFNLANKGTTKTSSPLPLAMIEGIGLFERTRFIEMGIDNAQNLAKSNFVEIIIRTPFNPREVIDWIGQARLYLYFEDEILNLRKRAGIRSIFNLKKTGDEGALETIAELTGIPIKKLTTVYMLIQDDNDIQVLLDATEKLIVGEKGPHQDKSTVDLRKKAGARGIFNLKKAGDENALETIAELSGLPLDKLTTVYTLIKDDKDIQVILDATEKLIVGKKGPHQDKPTAETHAAEAADGDQKA